MHVAGTSPHQDIGLREGEQLQPAGPGEDMAIYFVLGGKDLHIFKIICGMLLFVSDQKQSLCSIYAGPMLNLRLTISSKSSGQSDS
jgi:hypothetical protein